MSVSPQASLWLQISKCMEQCMSKKCTHSPAKMILFVCSKTLFDLTLANGLNHINIYIFLIMNGHHFLHIGNLSIYGYMAIWL